MQMKSSRFGRFRKFDRHWFVDDEPFRATILSIERLRNVETESAAERYLAVLVEPVSRCLLLTESCLSHWRPPQEMLEAHLGEWVKKFVG